MISPQAAWWVNFVLACGHFGAVIFVYVALAENDGGWVVPVKFRFNTWEETSPDVFTINESEVSVAKRFRPGLVLLLCSVISGCHHWFAVADLETYYAVCQSGFNGYRWLDYSLSAGVMLVANEVLWYAPPGVSILVMVFFLHCFIVLAGGVAVESWWADWKGGPRPMSFFTKYNLFISTMAHILLWFRYFYILQSGDEGRVPLFVYVILVVLVVTFSSFPIVFFYKIWWPPSPERNVYYEAWFWALSALAKIPLLVFFGTGLVARTSRVKFEDTSIPDDEQSETGITYGSITAALIIIIVGGILWRDKGTAYTVKSSKVSF